jgi:hypothetical protein
MRFIRTELDVLYPIDRIERIEIVEPGGMYGDRRDVMIYIDGKRHRTILNERDLALLTGTIVVPAERHSAVLYHPADAHGGEMVTIIPVVAFALSAVGRLEPLGLEGLDFWNDDNPVGILRPDGKVELIGEETFDDIEAFKNAMRRRIERERKVPVSVVG